MKRKYGVNGTIGPAFRFTWAETTCTDGTKIPTAYRSRAVKSGRALNKLRKRVAKRYGVKFTDVSINVNSWYRSPAYNKKIGGATFSQHVEGRATDVTVHVNGHGKVHPGRVAEIAAQVPEFASGGIGWYDEKHGSFTHVDTRPNGPARWINKG